MRTSLLATSFITLLFSFLSSHSYGRFLSGPELQIIPAQLGEPYYRSRFHLILFSSTMDPGNLKVKFLDKNLNAIDVKDGLRVKRGDFTNCSFGTCRANVYELPLALEKHSCKLEVTYTSSSGQIYLNQTYDWGDCIQTTTSADPKYLADFTFPSSAYFSDQKTIEIQNIGNSFLQKPLYVWGFLLDKESNVIWSDTFSDIITIQSQESYSVAFQKMINEWQVHLACTGLFIIDPDFETYERTKLNNSLLIDFGNCEEVPSEDSGDKIDFVPLIQISNGSLTLKALNNGRLPYLNETTKIETLVRYLDSNKNPIRTFSVFTGPKIYGFGDSRTVLSEQLPFGTCFVQAELNPNITIKESNYINNRTEFRACE
jgi:hypothetical protein